MTALSTSSTLADAISQWKDNSSYRRNNSATEAEAFREACGWLLVLRPTRARHGSQTFEFDVATLERQQAEAERFIATATAAGSTSNSGRRNVLHAKFTKNFRG